MLAQAGVSVLKFEIVRHILRSISQDFFDPLLSVDYFLIIGIVPRVMILLRTKRIAAATGATTAQSKGAVDFVISI